MNRPMIMAQYVRIAIALGEKSNARVRTASAVRKAEMPNAPRRKSVARPVAPRRENHASPAGIMKVAVGPAHEQIVEESIRAEVAQLLIERPLENLPRHRVPRHECPAGAAQCRG